VGWSFLAAGTIALIAAGIVWLMLRYRDVDHRNGWEYAMLLAALVGSIFVVIGLSLFGDPNV
jgi:MFS superfamily sulfate permease-like transporter